MIDGKMIDRKKRQTLKAIAAVTTGTAVGSIPALSSTAAMSDCARAKSTQTVRQVWPPIAVKTPVALSTRVSTVNNSMEIVLTNESAQPVLLTRLTPSLPGTGCGSLDLDGLAKGAHRQLAAGESVSISSRYDAMKSSSYSPATGLSAGLTVSTDADQFTAVSYVVCA